MNESMTKLRAGRYALVAAVAAALALPLASQWLRAQDEPAEPAAAAAEPAAQAQPAEQPAGDDAEPAKQATTADADAEPKSDAKSDDAEGKRVDPDAKADAKPGDAAEGAADPLARVIASAGDIKVTVGDFQTFVSGMPKQDQQQIATQPDVRRRVAEHLVKMRALAREAQRQKLDADPKLQEELERVRKQLAAQLDNARLQMLATALVTSLQGDDAADKKYFEEHPERFGKVQARHILIATRNTDPSITKPPLTDEQAKKKADEIRARLVKGEDFATVAKAESDDPGSKNTGGSYTFGRGEMVPAFEQTAFGMKENEISQPVQTPFGYHVIQLQKRLPGKFEDARGEIGAARVENFVKELLGGDPKLEEGFFTAPIGSTGPAGRQFPSAPGKGAAAPKAGEKNAPKGAK